jgi:hypothetical protein
VSACPWCREALPSGPAPAVCPRCGKQLADSKGERLRPLDLDFEKILADADERSLRWTKRGVVFALVLGAVALVPGISVVAALLLILGQFFWARFLVARPYLVHFGGVRRLVTRWLGRLFLIAVVSLPLGTVAAPVPGLGLVVGPVVFGGTCLIFRSYFRFHLHREHRREGVTFLEKVFLVILSFLAVIALIVFALIAWGVISFLPGGK